MILYKNNLIITPPKTGTNTLNELIVKYWGGAVLDQIGTAAQMQWHSVFNEHIWIENKKIYLLVRNPYERLISMYYFFVDKERPHMSINDEQYMSNWFKPNATFEDFVNILYEKRQTELQDHMHKPKQKEHSIKSLLLRSLSEDYMRMQADGFIRIEYLDEDLKKININITSYPDQKGLHLHKTPNRPTETNLYHYFTPEVLAIANTWCRQDAVLFGYDVLE